MRRFTDVVRSHPRGIAVRFPPWTAGRPGPQRLDRPRNETTFHLSAKKAHPPSENSQWRDRRPLSGLEYGPPSPGGIISVAFSRGQSCPRSKPAAGLRGEACGIGRVNRARFPGNASVMTPEAK
jgi:hypothetical protein